MASKTLQPWIDIPPLATPPLGLVDWLILLWPGLLLLLFICAGLWWLLRHPRFRLWYGLWRIRRQLRQQRLLPRQALFEVARYLHHPALQAKRTTLPDAMLPLLAQRFAQNPPVEAQVLQLLADLQSWVRR